MPTHCERLAEAVYFQVPAGTAASVQVSAFTVPLQADPIVCATLAVLNRPT